MSLKLNLLCISLAIAVGLTGCATTGTVNPTLRKDEPKFFTKSGGGACLIGASIAGLACMAIKDEKKLNACLIAAAAGCAVGMTANYMLDKTRADYHNLEDQLDDTKLKVQDSIKSTKSLQETSAQALADDKNEIEQIKENISNNSEKKENLERKLADMNANLNYMRKRLENDQNTLKEYKTLSASLKRGDGLRAPRNYKEAELKEQELDNKIEELEQNIAKLENSIGDYASRTALLKREINQISI